MKKTTWRSIVLMLTSLMLAGCASQQATQPKAFTDWPAGASPAAVGKKVATNMLPRWTVTRPSVHYAADSAWMTGLKFAALTGDQDLKASLVARFDPFLAPDGSKLISMNRHVDHNIFGIVPLEIYIQTGDKKYLEMGKMLADRQWEKPDPNGLSDQTRFWIDDMYMITILQLEAFRATGDRVYLDRAALEMVAYLDKLQRPNGLFYHGPKFPFFWGRGNGWVAGGMAELLMELPAGHPKRARIMEGYKKMMASLLKYQDTDGMWHQLIDHPESYKETSCTAMFTYAFITGAKKGWLKDAAYSEAARKGWLSLQTYIDADGNVDKVCVGTGQTNSLDFYLNRPTSKGDAHGQAPILWCAVALLR
jgi:unsaturated rhamnogalacturonyl hydrolase